ncbi:hypothetical protein [Nocardia miyunensis]|uniref:WXG100-like domain-containing protein n=1 Tax=Nocardia miyunensis TaxID=282684 RepID=UPI00082E8A2C|nr:hypothetical protein [Nocardia miyunensis]
MTLELPPELRWLGWIAGTAWPDGDEDAMWALSDAWKAAARALSALEPDVETAKSDTEKAYPAGAGADSMGAKFDDLISGEHSVKTLAEMLQEVSDSTFDMGTQLQATKLTIILSLAWLAAEIIWAWMFPPTAPAVEAGAIATTRSMLKIVEDYVQNFIERLAQRLGASAMKQRYYFKELLSGGKLIMPSAKGFGVYSVKLLEGAATSALMDGAVQVGQIAAGKRHSFDWKEFGVSMAASAAGSIPGREVARYLGFGMDKYLGNSLAKMNIPLGKGIAYPAGAVLRGASIGAVSGATSTLFGNMVAAAAYGPGAFGSPMGWVGGISRGAIVGAARGTFVKRTTPTTDDLRYSVWMKNQATNKVDRVDPPKAATTGSTTAGGDATTSGGNTRPNGAQSNTTSGSTNPINATSRPGQQNNSGTNGGGTDGIQLQPMGSSRGGGSSQLVTTSGLRGDGAVQDGSTAVRPGGVNSSQAGGSSGLRGNGGMQRSYSLDGGPRGNSGLPRGFSTDGGLRGSGLGGSDQSTPIRPTGLRPDGDSSLVAGSSGGAKSGLTSGLGGGRSDRGLGGGDGKSPDLGLGGGNGKSPDLGLGGGKGKAPDLGLGGSGKSELAAGLGGGKSESGLGGGSSKSELAPGLGGGKSDTGLGVGGAKPGLTSGAGGQRSSGFMANEASGSGGGRLSARGGLVGDGTSNNTGVRGRSTGTDAGQGGGRSLSAPPQIRGGNAPLRPVTESEHGSGASRSDGSSLGELFRMGPEGDLFRTGRDDASVTSGSDAGGYFRMGPEGDLFRTGDDSVIQPGGGGGRENSPSPRGGGDDESIESGFRPNFDETMFPGGGSAPASLGGGRDNDSIGPVSDNFRGGTFRGGSAPGSLRGGDDQVFRPPSEESIYGGSAPASLGGRGGNSLGSFEGEGGLFRGGGSAPVSPGGGRGNEFGPVGGGFRGGDDQVFRPNSEQQSPPRAGLSGGAGQTSKRPPTSWESSVDGGWQSPSRGSQRGGSEESGGPMVRGGSDSESDYLPSYYGRSRSGSDDESDNIPSYYGRSRSGSDDESDYIPSAYRDTADDGEFAQFTGGSGRLGGGRFGDGDEILFRPSTGGSDEQVFRPYVGDDGSIYYGRPGRGGGSSFEDIPQLFGPRGVVRGGWDETSAQPSETGRGHQSIRSAPGALGGDGPVVPRPGRGGGSGDDPSGALGPTGRRWSFGSDDSDGLVTFQPGGNRSGGFGLRPGRYSFGDFEPGPSVRRPGGFRPGTGEEDSLFSSGSMRGHGSDDDPLGAPPNRSRGEDTALSHPLQRSSSAPAVVDRPPRPPAPPAASGASPAAPKPKGPKARDDDFLGKSTDMKAKTRPKREPEWRELPGPYEAPTAPDAAEWLDGASGPTGASGPDGATGPGVSGPGASGPGATGSGASGSSDNPFGDNPFGDNPFGDNPGGDNPFGDNPEGTDSGGGSSGPSNVDVAFTLK